MTMAATKYEVESTHDSDSEILSHIKKAQHLYNTHYDYQSNVVATGRSKTTNDDIDTNVELQHMYEQFIRNGNNDKCFESHFCSRDEIVHFLYQVIDYYKEEREIVQVAMNYLDRYVVRCCCQYNEQSGTIVDDNLDTLRGSVIVATDGNSPVDYSTAPLNDTKHLFQNIGLVVLSSLDLAIKLYSPFSGDAKRAVYVEIMDHAIQSYRDLNHKNENKKPLSRTTNVDGNEAEEDLVGHVLKSFSYKKIISLHGTKYHGDKFETAIHLGRKLFTCNDFVQVQSMIMETLDYYLHPKTCTFFSRLYMDVLKNKLMPDDEHHTSNIENFVNMQMELSIFDITLAKINPSIISFSALQNALIQHFISSNQNIATDQEDHIMPMLKYKLHIVNKTIFNQIDCHDEILVKRVMLCLFQLWKKNNPSDVTFDESLFTILCNDTMKSTKASTMTSFGYDKKGQVSQDNTNNHSILKKHSFIVTDESEDDSATYRSLTEDEDTLDCLSVPSSEKSGLNNSKKRRLCSMEGRFLYRYYWN